MGNRLQGQVAIVTGSGRGIGRGVALLLAEEGAAVVVNDAGVNLDGTGHDDGPAAQVVREITEAGGRAVANTDSVAEFEGGQRMVQAALDNFGRVDILCHVAGILRDRMVFNMTAEEWDAVLAVHLKGAFNTVRNAVPPMIKQRYGRILLFSSGSGLGASGQANYSCAKEGMVGFARALASELAPYGINVNAIYPGQTITEATLARYAEQAQREGTTVEALHKAADECTVLKHVVTATDIGYVVAMLCSPLAIGVHGEAIGVDGGNRSDMHY
jgi:NAD(P)-dependent dehydrogenase (short-subunit alcohol dehydrogenase family)